MLYPEPPSVKAAVRRAGKAISEGNAGDEDFELVDQWRASHGYVINTFQAWFRLKFAKMPFEIEFAQRLKRRNTVIDKLRRVDTNGRHLIRDVTSMHDLAGCRLIFDSLDNLKDFRSLLHSNEVMRNVNHELRYAAEKYDYIERPRASGYRGIHDVYKHFPRGSKRGEGHKPWDGLMVEVQYRTRAQHAWATAVEISDLIDGSNTKFEMDQSKRGRFFALASEIIARTQENCVRVFLNSPLQELRRELQELEDELGIMQRLSVLRQYEINVQLKNHNVLNIFEGKNGQPELEVLTFKSGREGIAKASELEASSNSINAVYVHSNKPNQLRSAYRNYFNDPVDFVNILRDDAGV